MVINKRIRMNNLRTILLCVLFATQISAMELSQNSNKDITIPRQVETLFKLAAQCIAKHLKTYKEEQIICLSKEIKKELARQHYLINDGYILGFEEEDFTFSLAELINHGKITIPSDQKLLCTSERELLYLSRMQIHVIYSPTLQTIANKCSFIRELFLNNNRISKLPSSISELVKLEYLNLDHNQLAELPNSIGCLSGLRYLMVEDNQIAELPGSIGQLTNLKQLNLYNNQLTNLPDSIGQLTTNLKELLLHNNQLTGLPDSICFLTGLRECYLSNNQFSQKEQEKICALLPNTKFPRLTFQK